MTTPSGSDSPAATKFRGERLRELRESQGLDIAVLARRMALSAAQLRQLEQNQGTLFYSEAIRLAAARKVSEYLGEPLLLEPSPALPQADEVTLSVSVPQVSVELQADEAPTQTVPAAPAVVVAQEPAKAALPLAPADTSSEADVSRQRSGWRPWPSALVGGALASALVLGVYWNAPLQPATPKHFTERQPAEQVVAPVQVTGTAELSPSKQVDAAAEPVVTPTAAAPTAPSEPMTLAAKSADAPKGAADAVCGGFNGPADSFSPPKAFKDGSLVYVVGEPDQVVCLKDGQGKVSRHVFTSAAGQSFYGTAPWLVESAQLTALQIFFQGARVRLSDASSKRLRLVAAESF